MVDTAVTEPNATPIEAHQTAKPTGRGRLYPYAHRLREANVVMVTLGALIIGLAFGAVLIVLTTPVLLHSWGNFFKHPGGTFAATWNTVVGAYEEIFVGSIFDPRTLWTAIQDPSKANWSTAINPLNNTLTTATPLVIAGMGIAIGFRTSLFNIGGAGQIIAGGIMATWVGITFNFTPVLQVSAEVIAAMIGGGVIAGIAGVLKAYTGAHEVITTMMLNKIMGFLLIYLLLNQPFALPGVLGGQSRRIKPNGVLPHLLGWIDPTLSLDFGFLFAIAAAIFGWWFLNRSKMGFQFQIVGQNAAAAKNAGLNAKRITMMALGLSGLFLGLAGVTQAASFGGVLQTPFGGNIGFDAITVALLGRNKPGGVVLGALLFSVLEAGGHYMNVVSPTNIDYSLAQVIQAVIVFCVATPAIVVEFFRLKESGVLSFRATTGGWSS